MKRTKLFVFDTNVIVSAFLFPKSSCAKAFDVEINSGTILLSQETLEELKDVLLRDNFDKYLPKPIRIAFVQKFEILTAMIDITETITACSDPKDNKFLSLAVTANVFAIITGDKDLLVLNPFRNISIITPSSFLNIY